MKTNKIFILFISMFLVLLVGCSNGTKIAGDKIVVKKHVGKTDKYEYYNKIKDSKEVQKVKDILDRISWENAKVSMVSPPHYKFHFEDISEKQKYSFVFIL